MCNVCRMQRTHAVCANCRYSVKRWKTSLGNCPACRNPLIDMGARFKTPKKNDLKGWAAVGRAVAEKLRGRL